MTPSPPFNIDALPTPLALTANRVNLHGHDSSADTFLTASYTFECFLKLLVAALYSGLRTRNAEHSYKHAYALLRADGLGEWDRVLREITRAPASSFLPTEMGTLLTWVTKSRTRPTEDQWAKDCKTHSSRLLQLLGVEPETPRKLNVLHLIADCVQIRNKTKAHGAVSEDFYVEANPLYVQLVDALIANCPTNDWIWLRFFETPAGAARAIRLRGTAAARDVAIEEKRLASLVNEGLFTIPTGSSVAYGLSPLVHGDRQCRNFYLPNGGFKERSGRAEFLDYATGVTKSLECGSFTNPPAPLPKSETHAAFELDVHSNVFGNIPGLPANYVERPALQHELITRLHDRNHAIITLHGRGGVGKTYLALHAAHTLSGEDGASFEYVLWLSARDIDLRLRGPASVSQDVVTIECIARAVSMLLGVDGTVSELAKLLQNPEGAVEGRGSGVLMILDNFETLADVRGVHEFLDTHTHLPNKVLITSRERAFKADFPIEVHGMEIEEARQFLQRTRAELDIVEILTDERIDELFEYTGGHAYAMRVMAGEIAAERGWIPMKSILPRRSDVMQAVFERSFNRLSPHGRRVFLSICSFRSVISELAILVVLGQRDLHVEDGLDECARLSLLEVVRLADDSPAYVAPQLARIFARKKLEGDPDRLVIQEDVEALREFGVVQIGKHREASQEKAIGAFVQHCLSRVGASPEENLRLASMLEGVAEMWPSAWLQLFRFYTEVCGTRDDKEYALRRAVEEMPYSKRAWLERARFAKSCGDQPTYIAALVSAVDADPHDSRLIRETAAEVCRYISGHSQEIPKARRGVYLASVRQHMERMEDELDAPGLSQLAWLFLLEGDSDRAWHYANLGCSKDPTDKHCLNILERLDAGR